MSARHNLWMLVFTLFLIPPTVTAQVSPEFSSVSISPIHQEAATGTQLDFTVSGQTGQGGSILINVPLELSLTGQPTCTGSCRGPFVTSRSDGASIEVPFDGDMSLVSFSVMVSPQVTPGITLNIAVMMVGGVEAVNMSSATVTVIETEPTHAVPPAGDDRMVYLDMNPRLVRMVPQGDALFHIQPVRWGMWDSSPNVTVDINVPVSMSSSLGPFCGRSDLIPIETPCRVTESTEQDGSTTFSVIPGYQASTQAANGIYMVLAANSSLESGAILEVKISAVVDDQTLAEQPSPITSTVHIVENKSLLIQQPEDGAVGAVLELKQGFSKSGSACSASPSDSQLGLYDLSLETQFSIASLDNGQIGDATDGTGREVCHIPFRFTSAPQRDLYFLATFYGDDVPCRACIYGLITTTHNSEIVFPQQ